MAMSVSTSASARWLPSSLALQPPALDRGLHPALVVHAIV
jgi:hypothetical protein